MESSLAGKPERAGPVEVEDIRKDLLSDFSALPTLDAAQTENLQVFLRIRPFTSAESDSGEEQDCVTVEGPDTVILRAPRSVKSLPQTGQKFTFTQVFGPDSSQRAVFDGSVRTLVRDVLAGGNCLVFTYGVTNAGKTFTFLGPDHDSGLLPRSLSVIFNSIEGRLYQSADLKPLRCRDYTRLTPEQQAEDSATKRTLLKLFKESDRSHTSMKSTFLDGSNITDSSLCSDQDSFVVDDGGSAKFSVWVSFCEIYNDNIHDLLQHVPHGQQKRTVLRLSQDVKGNSFIKDLRWVQVSSSDEAYRIMKIGKKNQSMSSTRLNQLSSRSHSIFSVRLMKIDHVGGAARVLGISELSLCDLAGSERCSRTHNTGERLKEAGNINNSLLTLGKCISAMRNNQHNKFQQHIPFRESKLTHFLQFFFCGSSSGRVTMVVNINQSASCFDETLNVLKFSALAQKVVVLNSRPPPLAAALPRSAMEVSLIIDEAETRRFRGRKSSLVAWETSLEDVQEADDWEAEETEETEEMEEAEGDDQEDSLDEEETELEETVLEAAAEDTMDQRHQSHTEAALRLVLEAQIREEVSAEFMELFNKMEKDYSERLDKEREILEERAEKRVEILKNLVHRTIDLSALESHRQDSEGMVLEDFLSAQELQKIREQQFNVTELEKQRKETEQQLQELQQSLQRRQEQISELRDLCKQKEEVISKLTSALDQTVEDATRERSVVEAVRAELLQLQQSCSCLRERGSCGVRGTEERKRGRGSSDEESAPAKKRVLLEEEIWRLQEENDQKEQQMNELRLQHQEENEQKEQQINELRSQYKEESEQKEQQMNELRLQHQEENEQKEQQINELRSQYQEESEQKEQQMNELRLQHQEENEQKEQQINELRSQYQEESRQQEQRLEELREEWEKLLRDLREERDQANQKIKELREEKEQELEHLREENQQLEQLRLQLLEMETQMQKLSEEACPNCDSVFQSLESEQRETSRLNKENKALVNGIFTLQTEVTTLKQMLRSETDRSSSLSDELNSTRTCLLSLQSQSDDRDLTLQELRGEVDKLRLQGAQQDAFHTAMDRLKEESESALRESVKKERRLQDLQEQLQQSERLCADLREQSSNQTAACERMEAELKEQRDSFKQRLETLENQRLQAERENKELLQLLSVREDTVTEAHAQMETLRTELERLREQLQEPQENQVQEEEQENQAQEEQENQPQEEEQENQAQEEQENQPQEEQENQPQEKEQENQPQEEEQRPVTVVEQLREEMRKHRLRRNNRKQETGDENSPEEQENLREKEVQEQRRMEAVQREVQRFRELQNHSELQRAAEGGASPERGSERSRRTPRTTSRKRKSCELQGLVFSENKRNRGRAGLLKQSSSSVKDTTLTKLGEFITKSPSIISSTAKGLMELVVDGRSTGSKLKRGRRKLYKAHGSSPMLDSPNTGGAALEERESDHLTIKRQLRSKTRK